jgi:hypothetical protein
VVVVPCVCEVGADYGQQEGGGGAAVVGVCVAVTCVAA